MTYDTTSQSVPQKFKADIVAIFQASPETRLDVFRSKCRAIAGYVLEGVADEAGAFDALLQIGVAAKLIEKHGQKVVLDVIDDEFRTPIMKAAGAFIPAAANGKALSVRRASDIAPEPMEWLWPGRIGIGKLSLVAGVPGLGKSQFTAFLAAAVTANRPLPCDEGFAPQGSVIILSAEDDETDTIRPRLDAAGADPSRVLIVSSVFSEDATRRGFNLQRDLELLEQQIASAENVRLVIIDPISSYLGRVDSHKNADVRTVLEPLAELAARLRVAVVAVTHLSKGMAMKAADRVIGSIAFIAAARSAIMILHDPENPDRRLFIMLKNNLSKHTNGLAFRICERRLGDQIVASHIEWEPDRIVATADEVLTASGKIGSDKKHSEEFLIEMLGQGETAVSAIMAAAQENGIAWVSVKRAKYRLGIQTKRKATDLAKGGQWFWTLPPASVNQLGGQHS